MRRGTADASHPEHVGGGGVFAVVVLCEEAQLMLVIWNLYLDGGGGAGAPEGGAPGDSDTTSHVMLKSADNTAWAGCP